MEAFNSNVVALIIFRVLGVIGTTVKTMTREIIDQPQLKTSNKLSANTGSDRKKIKSNLDFAKKKVTG